MSFTLLRPWSCCAFLLSQLVACAVAQEVDADAARTQLYEAAEALGGLAKIQAIERMRLYGYGQEADGFGSGNVTGSPQAPQKYGAQNDLCRASRQLGQNA